MKLLKIPTLIVIFSTTCFTANAQEIVLERIDDAIEYALENNPTLEAYKLQTQITDYSYRIQRNSK
ncbi:MAG: hypothetical protein MI700_03020, partial [Balneolales bacterium]|nr:hypothetical protein [Balneolales bacterium]